MMIIVFMATVIISFISGFIVCAVLSIGNHDETVSKYMQKINELENEIDEIKGLLNEWKLSRGCTCGHPACNLCDLMNATNEALDGESDEQLIY